MKCYEYKEKLMTKLETMKCESLLDEAIAYAKAASVSFDNALKGSDLADKRISERVAWRNKGYAEGIYVALVKTGFKNERMQELEELIKWY